MENFIKMVKEVAVTRMVEDGTHKDLAEILIDDASSYTKECARAKYAPSREELEIRCDNLKAEWKAAQEVEDLEAQLVGVAKATESSPEEGESAAMDFAAEVIKSLGIPGDLVDQAVSELREEACLAKKSTTKVSGFSEDKLREDLRDSYKEFAEIQETLDNEEADRTPLPKVEEGPLTFDSDLGPHGYDRLDKICSALQDMGLGVASVAIYLMEYDGYSFVDAVEEAKKADPNS